MRTVAGVFFLCMSTGLASAATLQINLAADIYDGGADFIVLADDQEVGKGTADTVQGEEFSFEVPDDTTSILVRFTNDAAGAKDEAGRLAPGLDRNLVISSADLGDRHWEGIDFKGGASFARGQTLVLYTNTTVTLPLQAVPTATSEGENTTDQASKQGLDDQSVGTEQVGCDLDIAVTGYSSGATNLSSEQQAILTPAVEAQNCGVVVTGYSSTSGPASLNEQVALDRAQAVLNFLLAQGGKFTEQEAVTAGETEKFGPAQSDNRLVVVQLQ